MELAIRLADADDAAGVHAIYGPVVSNTPISFELTPPGVEEMRRRIVDTVATHPWLVCVSGEEIAGYAYAATHRARWGYQWAVDVSVYVSPAWRRRRVGHALYTALLPIVTAQGFYRACAGIALPNAASVALHEAFGFRLLGVYHSIGFKLGAWLDVGWWELELAPPPPGEPAAPMPIGAVLDTAAWRKAIERGQRELRQ
jgi:phosphinothricin acetyltransferase